MLKHILWGHKYRPKNEDGQFTFILHDLTPRDGQGYLLGTDDYPIFHLTSELAFLTNNVTRVNQRIALQYVYENMELVNEDVIQEMEEWG